MKLKWIKKCVLATAGNDTADASSSNIIFTIQDAKLCLCYHFLKKGQSKNVQNFLAKDWCIKTNIKQKAKIQLRQVSIDSFSNQTLYEPTDVYFGLLKHLCNTKR